MRVGFATSFALLFSLLVAGCSGREYVKPDGRGLLSFRFFLFAKVGEQNFRGSGDAVLEAGKSFRFRVYDNLLNARIFDFSAESGGRIEIADYTDKLLLRRRDMDLGKALVSGLPLFFRDTTEDEACAASGAVSASAVSNRLTSLGFGSGKNEATLGVSRRDAEGRPRGIEIVGGKDILTLEIAEYGSGDFVTESAGFALQDDTTGTPFLEWLGEAYGGR